MPVGLLVLGGIAAGALWRVVIPFFLDHSDRQEALFAAEGSLAVICAAAGLATGMLVLFRPGRSAAARTAVVLVASAGGALLAWLTGALLGAPDLMSTGIVLVWPMVTAVVIFTGAMLPVVSDRLNVR